MSRHLTLATGATVLIAFAGRGLAFSSRDDFVLPKATASSTPAPTSIVATASPKVHNLIQAQIKAVIATAAAVDPTITGTANHLIKAKEKQKDEDEDEEEVDIQQEGERGVCRTANTLLSYCAKAIPNIESAPEEEIARCLCCDGDGDFEPDFFDDAAMSCAGWIKTAVPESTGAYSAWSTLGTVCGGSGIDKGVCSWSKTPATASTPTSTPASKATATVITTGGAFVTTAAAVETPEACDKLGRLGGFCLTETRGFDDLPLSSQAECLCYMSDRSRSTTWVPDLFDDAYSSCAGTADTLSLDPGYVNICSRYGDFLAASVSAAATTTAEDSAPSSMTGDGRSASQTASRSVAAVTVTVTPSSAEATAAADTGAAPAGLNLPASWPVAVGAAVLGAAVLVL